MKGNDIRLYALNVMSFVTTKSLMESIPHKFFNVLIGDNCGICSGGWKRVAIVSGNDPWVQTPGNSFEAELLRIGGFVAKKIQLNPMVADVSSEASSIVGSKPDAVF